MRNLTPLLLLLAGLSAYDVHGNAINQDNPSVRVGTMDFILVGIVGDKRFYWESNNQNSTWIQSLEHCHKAGFYMASIENEEEQQFLMNMAPLLGWKTYINIAGTDIFTEGQWRWMRSGGEFSYTNWYPGSPYSEEEGGREWNCLGIDANSGDWIDIYCDKYPVITLCEFP